MFIWRVSQLSEKSDSVRINAVHCGIHQLRLELLNYVLNVEILSLHP